MSLTFSDFDKIWYVCRTFLPDSKYVNLFKIGQVDQKLKKIQHEGIKNIPPLQAPLYYSFV